MQPDTDANLPTTLEVAEFQQLIHDVYGSKDRSRGLAWSFAWLVEEVGELGAALRNLDRLRTDGKTESRKLATADQVEANLREEFADVFAWLSSLASMAGVDLADAARERYGSGCPYCSTVPCSCR